jgi:hypothetical protein
MEANAVTWLLFGLIGLGAFLYAVYFLKDEKK